MRAPSFRCTERPEDGGLVLHYYSDRPGLEHIVIGIVKTVASRLHGTEVDIEIIRTKEDCDHVQFLITETSGPTRAPVPEIAEIDTLSLGKYIYNFLYYPMNIEIKLFLIYIILLITIIISTIKFPHI